jgi:hypothetical protein
VSFFGRAIQFIGHGANDANKIMSGKKYNYVDNAYMKMFFSFGIIIFIVLIVMIYISLLYLYINKEHSLVLLSYIVIIFSMIDPILCSFRSSCVLFIIFPSIFSLIKNNYTFKMFVSNI